MSRSRRQGIFFSVITPHGYRVVILLLILAASVAAAETEQAQSNVVCRRELSVQLRDNLAIRLREISGWPELEFDSRGILKLGAGEPTGGSQSARNLLTKLINGPDFVAIEEASNRLDVVFSRVVSARWEGASPDKPRAHIVLIDFADFKHVMGDKRGLDAFNVGWVLLHELDHIATDSDDATAVDEIGECEAHINQMRRECRLPQRADYFFTSFPIPSDSNFPTKFVRLSFLESDVNQNKRRYWLIWDARLVGGLEEIKQIAALR
jgi:hypothetical protein